MQRFFLGLLFCLSATAGLRAQELYVWAEPASNMPAYSLSPRLKAMTGKQPGGNIVQRYTPELMLGISKNWMVHGAATFSNMQSETIRWEGAYVYAKYRFLSLDDVHRHFRMAAYGEAGYTNNRPHAEELSLRGDNRGWGAGVIATQLVHKAALSGTVGYAKHLYNEKVYDVHQPAKDALNWSLSAGYLILPVQYESYDQLNLNVYAELIGQKNLDRKKWFVDLAPSVQFIFKSNGRLNLGYRFQLDGTAARNMQSGWVASFEYTFFNALRKKVKST